MVSVIIPVFNGEKYIKDCIDSILSQTYKDYEIIIVDDGSMDSTGRIIDDYADSFDNIRVIHNSNHGPAYSRKIGFEMSTGEYISFVDADDCLRENYLEVFAKSMMESSCDIIVCNYVDIDKRKRCRKKYDLQNYYQELDSIDDYMYSIHKEGVLGGGVVCKLINRALFAEIDWNEEVTIGEDYAFVLQLVRKASKIRILNDVLYERKIHGENISRQGYTKRHEKALDHYIRIREKLVVEFPSQKKYIASYLVEHEMAVITAMSRNKRYDKKIINDLKEDLKKIKSDKSIFSEMELFYRISADIIIINPYVFIVLFRILHLLTGR